jgi:polyhydroxybutyrate depolymerase
MRPSLHRRARGWSLAAVLTCLVLLVAGCTGTDDAAPPEESGAGPTTTSPTASEPALDPSPQVAAGTTADLTLDGRLVHLHVPAGYDAAEPAPLVVALHGYTSNATELDSYLGLTAESDERGFLLVLPEGMTNPRGEQYWNAVEGGCCDFYGTGVDDSGHLSRLVRAVEAAYDVSQVAVVGHSNGGYMAHRFACEHADQVEAIGTLAGTLPPNRATCDPSRPVRVVHIHGDDDETVPYRGSTANSSAAETAETWARLDGCSPTPRDGSPLDLDSGLADDETTAQVWDDSCAGGSSVQLWTIVGGHHVPQVSASFTDDVLDAVLGV